MAGLIVAGILTTGGLILLGYLYAMSRSTSGRAELPPTKSPTTCDEFCTAWQNSRSSVCSAKMELQSAQDWFDTCGKTYMAAAASAAILSAIALASTFIPFVSAAAASAAGVAVAAMVTALGAMLGAAGAVATKQSQLTEANNAESAARLNVFENCTGDALATCLAMPPPC